MKRKAYAKFLGKSVLQEGFKSTEGPCCAFLSSAIIILVVSGPLRLFLYDGYINELNMSPVSPLYWNVFSKPRLVCPRRNFFISHSTGNSVPLATSRQKGRKEYQLWRDVDGWKPLTPLSEDTGNYWYRAWCVVWSPQKSKKGNSWQELPWWPSDAHLPATT